MLTSDTEGSPTSHPSQFIVLWEAAGSSVPPMADPKAPPTPFFADATLNMDFAHDLAETPEAPPRKILHSNLGRSSREEALSLPTLLSSTEEGDEKNNDDLLIVGAGAEERAGTTQPPGPQEHDDFPQSTSTNGSIREKASFDRISHLEISAPPSTPPRWPRDISWGVAFVVLVPISLVWPILMEEHEQEVSRLTRHPLSTATIHTLFWAGASALVLSRFLYRTPGGGEGDDARNRIAQMLTVSALVSVAVYTALTVVIWWNCPQVRIASLIPAWYMILNVFLFRRWKRRQASSSSSTSNTSRQAFFQALVCMALDVLSRSLRRESFFRVISGVLLMQFLALLLWRWAILGALGAGSWWVLIMAVLGGKWATGTITRLLSLVASGGVTGWMLEQAALVQDMPEVAVHDDVDAYRTVDASVYQGVDMDDVLDDDYEIDEDEFDAPNGHQRHRHNTRDKIPMQSTVKSLLVLGLTVSFGSVAQCGLLGGLAQFVWSQLRKVDVARTVIARVRNQGNGESGGFQGMQIQGDRNPGIISNIWNFVNAIARRFVRAHSDLAMSHVAAYYKNYRRAAHDVALLIDRMGVEPIIHDDISTHICSCVGGVISGIIVIFTGHVLLHQRKSASEPITDIDVVENMLIAFVLSYTMIFTVMEPLRASIKAIYVGFAQEPRSLSQSYPLIYHRLSRISESNTV